MAGQCGAVAEISIHAPGEGSDPTVNVPGKSDRVFQSTLPVRGATRRGSSKEEFAGFQSTLPVRGANQGIVYSARANHFNPRSR